MQRTYKKILAVLCAFVMAVSLLPMQTMAAAKPKFAKNYTTLYENDTNKGVYTYTVQNLVKGQKVKWSISGTGKSYARLSKTTTTVTKTTAVNKVTVKTKGKIAAKNKKVLVTARVYSKAGKLQYTLKSKNAAIKVNATKITITDNGLPVSRMIVGKKYQFQFQITPANATSTNVWTVTNSSGKRIEDMTKSGVFTPKTEGTYTVTVQAKKGSKVLVSDSKTVTVITSMTGAAQTTANKVVAVYSGNAKNLVKKTDFTIRNSAGAKNEVKSMEFSDDGTQVTLTTYDLLKDGTTYTVSDGTSSYDVKASVGKPVALKILTTKVIVGKETPIEYALCDANGIDVQAAYPGEITYAEKITNGYRTKDNKLYMTTVGDTGTITLTYKCSSDPTLTFTTTGTVVCVAANTSASTNLTLTDSENTPNYSAAGYKDNHKAASGSNYYVHFRALDTDNSEIKYDSIKFESSDPDTLVINQGKNNVARATAIKNGTVNIIVTATYARQDYTYVYEITVSEPSYLAGLSASQTQITMSNAGVYGYKGYINIDAKDQYGQNFALNNETASIVENGTNKANMVTYDAATKRLVIDAANRATGAYNYTLTLTVNGHKAAVSVTVIVQTPPYNGASSYRIDMNQPVIDLAVSSGDKAEELVNTKGTSVRVAEYRGGVFYNYVTIASAKITKNGQYYSNDLTKGGSSSEVSLGGGTELNVSAVSLAGNVLTKAQTGTYALELKFYPGSGAGTLATASGYLEITDSQNTPKISIEKTVASVSCKNALELAKNCLSVQGGNGTITACEVTGATVTGADYTLTSGQSVNIKSVVVQVTTTLSDKKTVVSNYTVSVGKTLKNL